MCASLTPCYFKTCDSNQKCELSSDGKTAECKCLVDYEMKNGKCEPKDYCQSDKNPCGLNSTCIQIGVGLTNVVCGCKPGYYPENGPDNSNFIP